MRQAATGIPLNVQRLLRVTTVAFFAFMLALATAAPTMAQEEEAPRGGYTAQMTSIDTAAQSFVADAVGLSEEPAGTFVFYYTEEDSYNLLLSQEGPSELTMTEFECIAEATLEQEANHFLNIDYVPQEEEGESTFAINTEADIADCIEEEDDGNGDDGEPEEQDEGDEQDDGQEVERAERVDTGAGATAATANAAPLLSLFGLLTAVGAVVLRKRAAN